MKRPYLLSLVAAVLLTVGIGVYVTSGANTASCANMNPANIEAAYIGDVSNVVVPDGHMLTRLQPKTDKGAEKAWMLAFKTMDGYTREGANNISVITENGKAPCSCSMEGACAKYYNPCPPDPNNPGMNLGGCCKEECSGGTCH